VLNHSRDRLIVVIDDDPLATDAMAGLLRSWGCRVITANAGALNDLVKEKPWPDLIISNCRLSKGHTGIKAIEQIRRAAATAIPAFLISGETDSKLMQSARACGYHVLHKPVDPMTLRAMVNQLLKQKPHAGVAE
jgi:CheY-like chemotaxis protein